MTRTVLRADAVLLALLGALLLASPWDALYRALDLPQGRPELWTQLAGLLLVALGYLLWVAPRDVRLTQAVALAAGFVNVVGAAVVGAWLLVADLRVDALGTTLLSALVVATAAAGAVQLWIASRSVAMLLPPD